MSWWLYQGHAESVLASFPSSSVRACVTSPPYWNLRNYEAEGQIGLERTPEEYIENLVRVFEQVRRVLTDDGTLWLNLGDCYTSNNRSHRDVDPLNPGRVMSTRSPTPPGLKAKELVGIPWRAAFALQAAGWYLRSDIVWAKPNPQPESVKDRPTRAHEFIFMLTKSENYFYDQLLEPFADEWQGRDGGTRGRQRNRGGRTDGYTAPSGIDPSANGGKNKRSVWTVTYEPQKVKHYASYPTKLIEPCVLASSAPGDFVLDPFVGTGTTGVVALRNGRQFIGIDINPTYLGYSWERLGGSRRQHERSTAVHRKDLRSS